MAESTSNSYSMDPTLWLYTSLTSGSSHIITATSRMETILKANRIPFKALDLATDEKARMLWGRRAGKDQSGRQRKIPGLVQMGMVIGDIVEVEDWNEYGELKQHIKIVPVPGAPVYPLAKVVKSNQLNKPEVSHDSFKLKYSNNESINDLKDNNDKIDHGTNKSDEKKIEIYGADISPSSLALRQLGKEAAQKAKETKTLKKTKEAEFIGVGIAEPQKLDITYIEKSNPEKIKIEDNTECKKEAGFMKIKTVEKEKENRVIRNESQKDLNLKDLYQDESLLQNIESDKKQRLVCEVNLSKGESINTAESEKKASDSCSMLENKDFSIKKPGPSQKIDSFNKIRTEKKPLKESLKRPAVILPPDSICIHKIYGSATNNASSFQSPNSCAWKNSIIQFASLEPPADRMESIQSPNSTAWKPASLDQRLSEVTLAEKVSETVTPKAGSN